MTRGIHWFRNDLRLADNSALGALVASVDEWAPVFVVDPRLATEPGAPRARFLTGALDALGDALADREAPLVVRSGLPERVLPSLVQKWRIDVVSLNEATTPFGRARDARVRSAIEKTGARVLARRDAVVFGAGELRAASGTPYRVYTPFRAAWWKRFEEVGVELASTPRFPRPIRHRSPRPAAGGGRSDAARRLRARPARGLAGLDSEALPSAGERAGRRRLRTFLRGRAARYHEDRDRLDLDGTSRLSPHLRFGTVSIRQCFAQGREALLDRPELGPGLSKWLDELVWREFYAAILEAYPHVLQRNFREDLDHLVWNDDADGFAAWCEGRTGYPVVDAAMRQLRTTGWMHNRARMIAGSFLTKDLLIDWRAGERYFFERLVDGDPASNNGGWQWVASTGADAQPYFRVFNPLLQGRRFDPEGDYVRRFVPELRAVPGPAVHEPAQIRRRRIDYPSPILDHAERRAIAVARFRAARAQGERRSGRRA